MSELTKEEVATLTGLLERANAHGQLTVQGESAGLGGRAITIDVWNDVDVLADDGTHTGRTHDELIVRLNEQGVRYLLSGSVADAMEAMEVVPCEY